MKAIKEIMEEMGDECEVNIDLLHETLLKLPAEKYLELYKTMYAKIYGYPPFLGFNGGCCGTLGDEQENNAKYYEEQPKISKTYEAGETE